MSVVFSLKNLFGKKPSDEADPSVTQEMSLGTPNSANIEAGSTQNDTTIGDDSITPDADPLPIDWKPRFGFEVAVLSVDLAAAKEVLEKLLDEEPADIEIPAQDNVMTVEPPLTVATETHPTVEVWYGNDERTAQFLTAAMQENEIPIHLENPGEQTRIYVSAANERRAREIVREVVEGAPPL